MNGKEKSKLRDKVVYRGRKKLMKMIKDGTWIDFMKENYGIEVIDEKNTILSKEFFKDIVEEVRRNKEKRLREEESVKLNEEENIDI